MIEKTPDASSAGRCSLCCVTLVDIYQLNIHINSKKHRTNLDWFQRVHAAKTFGKFVPARASDGRLGMLTNDGGSYDVILPHSQFIITEDIGKFIQDLPRGIVVREWEYYCTVCDVKLVDDDLVRQHTHRHSRGSYDSRRRN